MKGKHLFCFRCGMYSHRKEECPNEASGRVAVPENQERVYGKELGLEGRGMAGGGDGAVNPEIMESFGNQTFLCFHLHFLLISTSRDRECFCNFESLLYRVRFECVSLLHCIYIFFLTIKGSIYLME